MLHRLFTKKALVITACTFIIVLGTSTAFARSRRHMHNTNSTTPIASPSASLTATPLEQTANGISLLNGNWKYMPGMTKDGSGYDIDQLHTQIVNQDGTLSTENPPINVAGTFLDKVTGDFAINTTVGLNDASMATVQLYGSVPIIADEFRVERESVQMQVQNGKLTVNIWNGKGQKPSVTQTYSYTQTASVNLSFARVGKSFTFTVNNTKLGTITDPGVFKNGQVWFGFDSNDGIWILYDIAAQKLNGGDYTIGDGSLAQVTTHDPIGIQTLASEKRPGFIVGETRAIGPLMTDPEYQKVALDNAIFGSLTPENEMKMINLQPQKGVYTFQKADAMVKLAKQNDISVHGHTLVFAEANPTWFNDLPVKSAADKQNIENIMKDHITTVVKHFGTDVSSWDVINEPLADYDDFDPSAGKILRNHKWYQAMGEDYIVKAIATAHAANPDALLFINEYGLEEDGDRWDTFLQLIQRIKPKLAAAGVPTDKLGIGIQAHIFEAGDKVNPTMLKNHIETLGALGIKTQISENDVYSDDGTAVQAQQYANVFNACISEKNCIAWRGWTLSDRYDYFIDDDGSMQQGEDGLYSTEMLPRPGYTAIQQLLNK